MRIAFLLLPEYAVCRRSMVSFRIQIICRALGYCGTEKHPRLVFGLSKLKLGYLLAMIHSYQCKMPTWNLTLTVIYRALKASPNGLLFRIAWTFTGHTVLKVLMVRVLQNVLFPTLSVAISWGWRVALLFRYTFSVLIEYWTKWIGKCCPDMLLCHYFQVLIYPLNILL